MMQYIIKVDFGDHIFGICVLTFHRRDRPNERSTERGIYGCITRYRSCPHSCRRRSMESYKRRNLLIPWVDDRAMVIALRDLIIIARSCEANMMTSKVSPKALYGQWTQINESALFICGGGVRRIFAISWQLVVICPSRDFRLMLETTATKDAPQRQFIGRSPRCSGRTLRHSDCTPLGTQKSPVADTPKTE